MWIILASPLTRLLASVLRGHGILLLQAFPNVRDGHIPAIPAGPALDDLFCYHYPHPDRDHHYQRLHVRAQLPQGLEAAHQQEEEESGGEDDRALIQHRRPDSVSDDDRLISEKDQGYSVFHKMVFSLAFNPERVYLFFSVLSSSDAPRYLSLIFACFLCSILDMIPHLRRSCGLHPLGPQVLWVKISCDSTFCLILLHILHDCTGGVYLDMIPGVRLTLPMSLMTV